MMLQDLGQFIDSFGFIDVKVKNVTKCVTQGVLWVCAHMPHQIDQLYMFTMLVTLDEPVSTRKCDLPLSEYG